MRIISFFLLWVALFGLVVGAIYWFTSKEQSGTVMLIASGLLGLLPGSYYLWWSRRMRQAPEDNPAATPQDAAGVVGAFPDTSIWPPVIGGGVALVALAFVFGPWTAAVGLVAVVGAVLGVIAESRRGGAV